MSLVAVVPANVFDFGNLALVNTHDTSKPN
jgi:hypothetical protein